MKKLAIILLIFTLIFSACNEKPSEQSSSLSQPNVYNSETTEPQKQTAVESESKSESSTEQKSETSAKIESYLDVPRFEPKSFSKKHFSLKDSNYVFGFELPTEWSIKSVGTNGKTITRLNKEIGQIVNGSLSDIDGWTAVSTREKTKNILQINEYIEEKNGTEPKEYRYRWRYSYEENGSIREMNVIVTCAEVPDLSTYRMMSLYSFNQLKTNPNLGILSKINPESILIFGNSFVATSQIGNTLQEMMSVNGKDVTVTAKSLGMANIGVYATDEYFLDSLRQGQYDLVVAMGFYNVDDTLSLATIKEASEQGGATVVTLPAHNELIASARKSSKECGVVCLEWLTEIDTLINGGISKWLLCRNDSYYHSTPLAGYVGAHMLYRALYGEVPSAPLYSSDYDISELGDYSLTGVANSVPPSEVNEIR